MSNSQQIFAKRLKQARKLAGLTQVELGVKIGLSESVASARISRYESGIHDPDLSIVNNMAKVLNLPLPFFFCHDDVMANFFIKLAELNTDQTLAALTLFTEKVDTFKKVSW